MILITRPKAQARLIKLKLKNMGYKVICYPQLKIEFNINITLPEVDLYNGLIITSQNTAQAIKDYVQLKDINAHVVGEKTAKVLRNYGFKNIVSISNDYIELISKIKEELPYLSKLLYLHGDHVAGDIKRKLMQYHIIDNLIVYKSVEIPMSKKILCFLRNKISMVLFYSPRTAALFAKNTIALNFLNISAICISQNTADELSSLNFKEVKIAKLPNEDSMLEHIINE
ncbi:uroporphyrinogen-III synthase [Holosporaceae bacterium 'Namur']|nr:uroporphyrinogen-III synthase [Holosporaceae bacterium 'Namur']